MATCRSCGAEIIWARHYKSRKAMPLENDPGGAWAIECGEARPAVASDTPLERYSSHFVSCPQAAEHRRPR